MQAVKVDLGGVSHTRVRVFAYPINSATLLSITLAPVAALSGVRPDLPRAA